MIRLLFLIVLLAVALFTSYSSAEDGNSFATLTTINRYEVNTTDFDRVDDVRTFTSEALFAESSLRLNRSLTKDELSDIARTSEQFETFNNIRFTQYGVWPNIDLFYKYKIRNELQITNFFDPDEFIDVHLNEYGLALHKNLDIGHGEWLIRGAYKHSRLKGTIEFWPDEEEIIDSFELNVAYLSRPSDKDHLLVTGTLVDQNIEQTIPEPNRFDRDRTIAAGLFAWGGIHRSNDPRPVAAVENAYARRFDPRNLKIFGGLAYDVEKFGQTDITRKDYYVGTSMPWNAKDSLFHIAVQGTVFTYDVDTDSTQDNSQYRTNITAYYQSSERLLFVVPFRHDLAIDGPEDFENWRLGIEARWNWMIGDQTQRRANLSAGVEVQKFYNIDKVLSIARLNFSVVL